MAKKKDVLKKEVKVTLMIDSFISEYKKTSGKSNSYGAAFKIWWNSKDKNNIYVRKTLQEWINEFEKYLSSPVK